MNLSADIYFKSIKIPLGFQVWTVKEMLIKDFPGTLKLMAGQGIVDWKEFFTSRQTGGVKNIFVEMGMETFKGSAAYINSL